MAAPTNSGDSDMATEELYSDLWSLLYPMFSPPRLTPLPPPHFLPSSSSMVIYQGSNQSMDDLPQNQEHKDIVDPALYLAGDSALLQQQQLRQNWSEASDWRPRGGIMTMNVLELQSNNQGFEESNMGFEESEEMMMTCFNFSPSSSPTNFPLCRPMPSVFFVSSEQENISLAFSYQHILEDKSGAWHVINDVADIFGLLFDDLGSFLNNEFSYLEQIARAAGVLQHRDVDGRMEKTLRRINWWEQHDEDIVGQPVYEQVGVVEQLIQNKDGKLDLILGGGVLTINEMEHIVNGLEHRDGQGLPTTTERRLQAKGSCRVWLTHDSQRAAEIRLRCNRLNNGSFTIVEDAISAYELVVRWGAWKDLTGFAGLCENENRSNLPLQLPLPAQELNPVEDFRLVCCNGMRNDEIESVGTGSEGTTNGVRIAIPLEDISQTIGMILQEAANHLGAQQANLDAGFGNDEAEAIRMGGEKTREGVIEEARLNSGCLKNQGKRKVNTPGGERGYNRTTGVRIAIPKEDILRTKGMRPKDVANHLEDFGNVEAEAIGMGSGGTGQSDIEEGQLNSRYLGKEKRKEMTPGGERRNKKDAISLEDILRYKEMPQKVAAKHLNVGLSTLKRACRGHGFPSWPPCVEHNQSRPNESPAVVDKEPIPQLNSDTLLPSNQVSATIGTGSVTVKASFGTVKMKFQLSCPWRMVELKQEVDKRLEHEAGNYHITYKDEDNDYILIACDEDLQGHISRSSLPGTNSIEVFLKPK